MCSIFCMQHLRGPPRPVWTGPLSPTFCCVNCKTIFQFKMTFLGQTGPLSSFPTTNSAAQNSGFPLAKPVKIPWFFPEFPDQWEPWDCATWVLHTRMLQDHKFAGTAALQVLWTERASHNLNARSFAWKEVNNTMVLGIFDWFCGQQSPRNWSASWVLPPWCCSSHCNHPGRHLRRKPSRLQSSS